MNQENKLPELMDEVNELVDILIDHDDFNMVYKNVKAVITDDSEDMAKITIDGETVVEYRYGGPRVWPTFVDKDLLMEALDVVKS